VQEHLKERLTGAVILVAVVVLLVPEMFRGRPGPRSEHAYGAGDELPLRSYTIELGDRAAARAIAPSSGPAPDTVKTVDATPVTAPVPAPALAQAPITATADANAPTAATTPAVQADGPPPTAMSAPTPVRASESNGTVPTARTLWTVQVATFTRRDFAERMAHQLRSKGFGVVIAGPDDKGRFRVRSPATADRAGAQALRQKMLAKGFKPIVNTAP